MCVNLLVLFTLISTEDTKKIQNDEKIYSLLIQNQTLLVSYRLELFINLFH